MQKGPSEKVIMVCGGCEYKKSKYGFSVCTEPHNGERAMFVTDKIPEWCPYNEIQVNSTTQK